MNTSNGSGIILILIFIALIFFIVFLVFKRNSNGILGNRFLIPGVIVVSVIFFLLVKVPIVTYYQQIFKEAPYDFSELRSIVFKYGNGDTLVNTYNSQTGEYRYLNKQDSLVKTNVLLTRNNLLYLHRKAAELGFWDFPANETSNDTTRFNGARSPRYYMEFNYRQKSKKVLFDAAFEGNEQLKEANEQLIKEIMHVLAEAEDRKKK